MALGRTAGDARLRGDYHLYEEFFCKSDPEDLRLRFFGPMKTFDAKMAARLTQLDYARAMAFAALDPENGDLFGVVRLHTEAGHESGEFAVIVRSDVKGRGLGSVLMRLIVKYARTDGLRTITGQVLDENEPMLAMAQQLGFEVTPVPQSGGTKLITLVLD